MTNLNYFVAINESGNTIINDIEINNKIFQEELCDYKLVDLEQQIDDLIIWISQNKGSDKYMMLEDLKELLSLEDSYVFSSISTNEYIAKSTDPEKFNSICKEILQKCIDLSGRKE